MSKFLGENMITYKKSLSKQDVSCLATPSDFGLRRDVQKNIFSHLSSPVPSPDVLRSGLQLGGKLTLSGMPGRAQDLLANLFQCRIPQGHSLLWAPPCSSVGSCPGCRGVSAPPRTFMGCITRVIIHYGMQGNFCSAAWSTSSPFH